MPSLSRSESASYQDYLLCIEMSVFSVVQFFAFNANEFYSVEHIGFANANNSNISAIKSLSHSNTNDNISDTDSHTSTMSNIDYNTNHKPHFKKHINTLAQTLNLTDVYHDTKRTFNPKYNQYNHYNDNDVEIGESHNNITVLTNNDIDPQNQSIFTTLFNGNRTSNNTLQSSQLLTVTEQLSARQNDGDDNDTEIISYHSIDPLSNNTTNNKTSNKYTLDDDSSV